MEVKEKPNWLENLFICKVWKANYAMNQNESQYQFALDWGLKTKYCKPHYCSMTDRDHKLFMDYEKDKKLGKLNHYTLEVERS